jgi:two-component system OmpR family response regulator
VDKILVVDDDTMALAMFGMALRLEGWQVRTARYGKAALTLLADFHPDIVVLDLRLGSDSGSKLLETLRKEPNGARVPVIAISGDERHLERARRNPQFATVLAKPFQVEQLAAEARELLSA